jgi:hypothetical protein
MSADRDRGIRRQKQKRAKDRKRAERRERQAGVATRSEATPPGAASDAASDVALSL